MQDAEFENYRKIPDLRSFIVNALEERKKHHIGYENQFPPNLDLISGSFQLDLDSSALEKAAVETPTRGRPCPFFSIYNLLRQAVHNLGEDYIVVFDTNPSFTIITRLALVAAEELIVPSTIDEFSGGGVKSLLLQIGLDSQRDQQGNLISNSFRSLIERHQASERLTSQPFLSPHTPPYKTLPTARVRAIVINRAPLKNRKAVSAIKDSFYDLIAKAHMQNPEVFAPPHVSMVVPRPTNFNGSVEFVKNYYFHEICDIGGAIGISHNLGIPITCLTQRKYTMRFSLHALENNGVNEEDREPLSNSTDARAGPDSVRFANQIQVCVLFPPSTLPYLFLGNLF